MTTEDHPSNDVAPGNINRTGRRPPAYQHRLTDMVEEREITRNGHNYATEGGGDGHRGTSPRVKRTTRQHGLGNFLGDQRKEEDDTNIVHEKGGGMRESVVAIGECVGPEQSEDAADRQGEQIVEYEARKPEDDVSSSRHRWRVRRLCLLRGGVVATHRNTLFTLKVPASAERAARTAGWVWAWR